MEIITIAVFAFLTVSVVLAITKRKKPGAIEAKKAIKPKKEDFPQIQAKPAQSKLVSEQKQAVQLVHDGLANVLSHLTAIPGYRLETASGEISRSDSKGTGEKHCPVCHSLWNDSFDFCLLCGQTENKILEFRTRQSAIGGTNEIT